MKVFLRVVLLAILISAAVVAWRKYYPSAQPEPAPSTPAETTIVETLPGPLSSPPRMWIDQNGRSFEGSLISAKKGQVVIRRQSDSACFKLPVTTLSLDDQAFVEGQMEVAEQTKRGFVEQLPGYYTLSRKLEIKGYLTRVPASDLVGGWLQERFDPVYLLLLSPDLHGTDSGSLWVRVDEKFFRAQNEGNLLNQDQLPKSADGKNGLAEPLSWPRPQVTIVEAQYGPHAYGINVTYKLMSLASQNALPVEIKPETFGLSSHAPATWELTILWRTATGEVRRTLRDGASLTWP
ncbi:MAG: y domain 1 [Rariglobus sp.]|jgi:hypothetical protein|nr:y domain 1 [Rariglobus sp.]